MPKMATKVLRFLADENGQDLIEYTLLLGVMGLTAALIFVHAGVSVSSIWSSGSTMLSNAVIAGS
jgi:Flp pilus assembly pilin Flp